ncbi:uncharacterized protein TRIREDRAFT_108635 [Trichoderma reesei QM6a]|uniref:Predicted protein n=2 Tax=Hypocrea jecorina TaxID=51453 RepID=G0RMC6_HYPJQ|nr:uncharacterized protein TRIREDRAFT_108635 [Trichoderma reesei QM6a]EGR47852.1 predicted protein [Trichoderma reesei QM6a]ETS01055.1 hypothetical protein M419DRAFT_81662 [Trichoderma reesei RUT C-30]
MPRLDTSMETHRLTHSARHYSYECKAPAQERPYVSRPSRSQQLRNPKLVPKLTSDTPNPLEKKKGVADEELAKLEAERERKRKLEEREDELSDAGSRRQRSVSSHSVSTISTGASRDSRSPSPRRRTRSPTPPKRRGYSPERRDRGDSRSRSPQQDGRPYRSRDDHNAPRGGHRGGRYGGQGRAPPSETPREAHKEAPRERSLSPFSKRLALTQSMNMGGR